MKASRPRFRGLPIEPEDEGTGLLPWSWAEERLERARSYWLSTTRPNGSPHAMPVWGIWLDRAVLFDTHPLSQKARNLECDPHAVMHLESAEDVVILEGTVEVEEDVEPALLERFRVTYRARYGREALGAFEFTPTIGYAWADGDFRGSATRFSSDAQ